MMKPVDEAHIDRAAREITANPNCHRVLYVGPALTHTICGGRLKFSGGKVHILDACDEPCEFVCKTSRAFEASVSTIRTVIRALELTHVPTSAELTSTHRGD